MKKFCVFSGFLGSGKTTTMMALTQYFEKNHGAAAMISNDLGGSGLADNRFAQLRKCHASEITGDCICYQTENLTAHLNQLFDEGGFQLVISDIPGFGVGALEHVYHTLHSDYPDMYELAPFTVLAEPATVDMLRSGNGGDLEYILHAQLQEADLIVLNKCDLLDACKREQSMEYLRLAYPQARVIAISALKGWGLEELSQALKYGKASLRQPDIGYGGEAFAEAMDRISEYYIQYHAAVCCNDFDANAYLMQLAKSIRQEMKKTGMDIPHLKLLAWTPEGDYGKVDILGAGREVEVNQRFDNPCVELAVVINASAAGSHKILDELITGAVERISEAFRLELMIFRKECFGMGG